MEDTDSMAIVATQRGGLIPCPGGTLTMPDGQAAIRALSWPDVRRVVRQFAPLNPYARSAVPGSVLVIEKDNFDPVTKQQRPVYCLAISAKRYALFVKNAKGLPTVLRKDVNNERDRGSQHGLGHLRNPVDLDSEDRNWIAQAWLAQIRKSLGLPTRPPAFADLPAVGRVSVSSPFTIRPFRDLNAGRTYPRQIKPHNFLITCHTKALGHPPGVDPTRFHLVAPYEPDPRRWRDIEWTDQYSGRRFRIVTTSNHGSRRTVRVKTYGEVLAEYGRHPEAKCADAEGNRCGPQTVGLLRRRHVRVAEIRNIGKESNHLEEVEAGLAHSAQSVYTEYRDPRRDGWLTRVVPALKHVSLKEFERVTGKSRRILIDARTGRRRPHKKQQELLASIVRTLHLP